MRLVDADYIMMALNLFNNVKNSNEHFFNGIKTAKEIIQLAPIISPKPTRHGRWVTDEDGNIKCSECGHRGVGDNYCERCGAKMDEVETDETN